MKKFLVVTSALFVFSLCPFGMQSWAFSLIDPFLNESNSTVASFNGQLNVGINETSSHWNGSGGEKVYESPLLGEYTYGYEIQYRDAEYPGEPLIDMARAAPINNDDTRPLSTYFARSTINTTQGFLSSEANHPGVSGGGVGSSLRVFTRDLPSSASFNLSGGVLNQYATAGIGVYASTPTGLPLSTFWDSNSIWYGFMPDRVQGDVLGYVTFTNNKGILSWQVEQWSWTPPSADMPTLGQEIIAQGSGAMDFTQLSNYIQDIVNDRTTNYYYEDFVNVFSSDSTGAGYIYAQLN